LATLLGKILYELILQDKFLMLKNLLPNELIVVRDPINKQKIAV
jgi:hypothetical protein